MTTDHCPTCGLIPKNAGHRDLCLKWRAAIIAGASEAQIDARWRVVMVTTERVK